MFEDIDHIELEKTKKLLKIAKKNHRLSRARCWGNSWLIIYFWIGFGFYLMGILFLSFSTLPIITIFELIDLFSAIFLIVLSLWIMTKTFRMRKLLKEGK